MSSNEWRKKDPDRAYRHLKKWREKNPSIFKSHRQKYRNSHKLKIAENLQKRRDGEIGPFTEKDGPDWKKLNSDRFYQLQRNRQKISRNKLRLEAINMYGGKCFCCGEKNPIFLALDHIKGNGNQHRKQNKIFQSHVWAKKNKWPLIFRVACHNCNFALYHCDGICPHQL